MTGSVLGPAVDRALTLSDVEYRYRRRSAPVFGGVSCSIGAGEVVHVAGRNGVGKSTLLHVAAGLRTPTSGIVARSPGPVGYAPAHFDPSPALTTRRLLRMCARAVRASRPVEQVARELDLSDWLDVPITSMSSGTRQRLNLAQTLLGDPRLLVLDEPFAAVDQEYIQHVADILLSRVLDGAAIMFAEHAPEAAAALQPTRTVTLDAHRLTDTNAHA